MSRRFLSAVIGLSATAGMLLGLVIAGSMTPARAVSAPQGRAVAARLDRESRSARRESSPVTAVVSFADVAERLNPAVVNIDAQSRVDGRSRQGFGLDLPEDPARPAERERGGVRFGAGTGFLIDAEGHILTSHHVVAAADRLTVRLGDGRSFQAKRVGSDPDTDIALLKVDASRPLPFAALGDSDELRVGEWVVAIGNPLAYEHTVTVGVVSFIGRKLFNTSLDRYIQTDAAITFGNSGGPLINVHGEVVGINSAVSSRASNIGFAVPINQATAILPQLREKGRVTRGYIGVALRDVDADLQQSLHLRTSSGALVEDVTEGSPGARAGVRIYDLIVAVDGKAVAGNEQLVQLIAAREPGTLAQLHVLRNNRAITIPVKLAERPSSAIEPRPEQIADRPPVGRGTNAGVGLSVRALDRDFEKRARLPEGSDGVVVSRVEPLSPAFDAGIERGHVVLDINRQAVHSVEDYRRMIARARAGDVLTLRVYKPETLQKTVHTLTVAP